MNGMMHFSLQKGCIRVVKSTNKYNLKIQPNESITVSGCVRKIRGVDTAVTEVGLTFVPESLS